MNLGYLYNKKYFQSVFFSLNGKARMDVNPAMDTLLAHHLSNAEKENLPNSIYHFTLKTLYPGLLCGAGYEHEIGGKEMEDEYKLGVFFDYTTGLPVIPGSSIKGMLRSACEMRNGNYIIDIAKELNAGQRAANKGFNKSDIEVFLKSIADNKAWHHQFIDTVFEGKIGIKGISIYKRDVFLDAFPIKSEGKLFGNDYITHHESPLKNPNPIQFLRVQPKTTYQFRFVLYDSKNISANLKLEIFRQIILDLGLGAKTNVGYGQFSENDQQGKSNYNSGEKKQTEGVFGKEKIPENNSSQIPDNLFPKKAIPYLRKDQEFEGTVTKQIGDYFMISFEVHGEKCLIRKKPNEKLNLKPNMKVRVICANDFSSENPHISIKNK